MIQTYKNYEKGRTKVFLTIRDGEFSSVIIGNQAVTTEQGIQFYVDYYVADQLHKCDFYLDGLEPKLKLKDGETLDIPDEVEQREREIQELERRLKELKNAE